MPVIDELRGLSATAQSLRERSLSERDTERLLVDPFIGALGYNTRDIDEVETQPRIPVGSTEVKCDYAIKRDGVPLILIEGKRLGLRLDNPGQLGTYFERERAVWLGVYTNGLEFRFYCGESVSGLKQMDAQPFMTLDLLNFDNRAAEQVSAFAKDRFDPNEVKGLAQRIKDRQSAAEALRGELRSPSDGLVRLVMNRVGADDLDRYKPIVTEVACEILGAPNAQPQPTPALPSVPMPSGPTVVRASGATPAGITIYWGKRGRNDEAILLEQRQGRVWLNGQEFSSPSGACKDLTNGAYNGWDEWEYDDRQTQRRQPITGLRGLSDDEQMRRAGASMGFVREPQPRSPRA